MGLILLVPDRRWPCSQMEACVFTVCACSLSRKQSVVTLPTVSDKVGYQAQWASTLVWKSPSLCAFPFPMLGHILIMLWQACLYNNAGQKNEDSVLSGSVQQNISHIIHIILQYFTHVLTILVTYFLLWKDKENHIPYIKIGFTPIS